MDAKVAGMRTLTGGRAAVTFALLLAACDLGDSPNQLDPEKDGGVRLDAGNDAPADAPSTDAPSEPCQGKRDGEACGAGMHCSSGTCACANGTLRCSDACVNAASDPRHCGACGNDCLHGTCKDSRCEPWVVRKVSALGALTQSSVATDGKRVAWLDGLGELQEVPVAGGPATRLGTLSGAGRLAMANGVVVAAVPVGISTSQIEVWTATSGSTDSAARGTTIGIPSGFLVNYGLTITPSGGTAYLDTADFTGVPPAIYGCVLGLTTTCPKLTDSRPSDLGSDILANASYLFWTHDGTSVKRYSFADKNVVNAATGQGQPFKLALSSTHVFWANLGTGSFVINRTSQANPNPTAPEPVMPSTTGTLEGLAADDQYLYIAGSIAGTKLGYVPLAGGQLRPLYSGTGQVRWLAVAQGAVYFLDDADQTVRGIATPRPGG